MSEIPAFILGAFFGLSAMGVGFILGRLSLREEIEREED